MKKIAFAPAVFLCFAALSPGQGGMGPEAKLVRPPFIGGDVSHAIEEAALDLKGQASGTNDAVAIRLCSKGPMPVALATATASPFVLLEYLERYGFTRERVLFLRSEDCLSNDPSVTVTEFWALPRGASPPPSADGVKASRTLIEVVRTGDMIKSATDYDTALRELAAKLHAKSEATGVIVGAYYEQTSRALQKNLRHARRILRQNGVPAGRFYVRAAPDPGVHEHGELEPSYPNLFVVEIGRDGDLVTVAPR